jgi:hypothetical protein
LRIPTRLSPVRRNECPAKILRVPWITRALIGEARHDGNATFAPNPDIILAKPGGGRWT